MKEVVRLGLRLEKEEEGEGKEWGWNEERVNWSLPGEKGKMLGWGREKKKEAMLD